MFWGGPTGLVGWLVGGGSGPDFFLLGTAPTAKRRRRRRGEGDPSFLLLSSFLLQEIRGREARPPSFLLPLLSSSLTLGHKSLVKKSTIMQSYLVFLRVTKPPMKFKQFRKCLSNPSMAVQSSLEKIGFPFLLDLVRRAQRKLCTIRRARAGQRGRNVC